MRWGWVLMGISTLGACGTVDEPSSTEGAGSTDQGGSTGTGGGTMAGVGGGEAGAGGAAVAPDACLATCCDGTLFEGTSADAMACEIEHGVACADGGGPVSVVYGGEVVWEAKGACPTMSPCSVNCCSGVKVPAGDHFDTAVCATLGKDGDHCAGEGGPAKVFLGEQAVFQKMACDGACQTNCCDGTVAFGDAPTQDECEVWAGRMCLSDEGGPSVVAHGGTMLWTAGGQCPSLKDCIITCVDGESMTTTAYQEKVCITETLKSGFCADHDGPGLIAFDSELVWQAP